jgi:hypothetical protein
MSDYEMRALWRRLHNLPHNQVQWLEEAIGPDALPVHRCHAAGTPDEAIDRWRALLLRCRTDRHWYAARLTILDPPPAEPDPPCSKGIARSMR